MAVYGITATGFVKKTFDVIVEEMKADARTAENFGPDVDVSSYSPIGILININAKRIAEKWDVLEDIYYNNQVDNSSGVQLERVVALRGFFRLPAQKSLVVLTFGGTPGSSITTAMICQTAQGIKFQVTVGGAIGGGGTVDLQARAVDAGSAGNVPADSITQIVTPAAGVDTVNNDDDALGGSDIESDDELRARFKGADKEGAFGAPVLQRQLLAIDSVLNARVFENNEDFQVGDLPAHSINAVIEGGTPSELFPVFAEYKPMGIKTIGAQALTGTDGEGVNRNFNYDVPANVDIYTFTIISISGISQTEWVNQYGDEAKRRVIAYIGGSFDGVVYPGQGIGADIEAIRVSAAIADLPFVVGDMNSSVGKAPSPAGDRVILEAKERGRTDGFKAIFNILVV